jgi:hypothetical protein
LIAIAKGEGDSPTTYGVSPFLRSGTAKGERQTVNGKRRTAKGKRPTVNGEKAHREYVCNLGYARMLDAEPGGFATWREMAQAQRSSYPYRLNPLNPLNFLIEIQRVPAEPAGIVSVVGLS